MPYAVLLVHAHFKHPARALTGRVVEVVGSIERSNLSDRPEYYRK